MDPDPSDKRERPRPTGTLVFRSKAAIISGVVAWVEVDGERKAEWKVGAKELSLDLAAETYRIAIYSTYRGVRRTIYDDQVKVVADKATEIKVGP